MIEMKEVFPFLKGTTKKHGLTVLFCVKKSLFPRTLFEGNQIKKQGISVTEMPCCFFEDQRELMTL